MKVSEKLTGDFFAAVKTIAPDMRMWALYQTDYLTRLYLLRSGQKTLLEPLAGYQEEEIAALLAGEAVTLDRKFKLLEQAFTDSEFGQTVRTTQATSEKKKSAADVVQSDVPNDNVDYVAQSKASTGSDETGSGNLDRTVTTVNTGPAKLEYLRGLRQFDSYLSEVFYTLDGLITSMIYGE